VTAGGSVRLPTCPPAPGGAVSRAARRDVPKGPSEARPLTPTRQVLHPPPDTNLQQTRWLSQPWNDRSRPGTPTPGRPGTPTLGLDSHNPTRRQHVPNSSTPLHRSLETARRHASESTKEGNVRVPCRNPKPSRVVRHAYSHPRHRETAGHAAAAAPQFCGGKTWATAWPPPRGRATTDLSDASGPPADSATDAKGAVGWRHRRDRLSAWNSICSSYSAPITVG
jgi:hypothetical protein